MAKPFYISIQTILKAENKALAIHKTRFSDGTPCDIWSIPGGKMEDGETVHETIQRELKEELDLDLGDQTVTFVGYVFPGGTEFSFKDGNGSVVLTFLIELDNTFDPTTNHEIKDYVWLDYDEFLNTEFHSKKIKMKDIIDTNVN